MGNGQPGLEADYYYASSSKSDGPGYEEQSQGILVDKEKVDEQDRSDVQLWKYGEAKNVYGSRNDLDKQLAAMKGALISAGGKGSRDKKEPIRPLLMLKGILHLVVIKTMEGERS